MYGLLYGRNGNYFGVEVTNKSSEFNYLSDNAAVLIE